MLELGVKTLLAYLLGSLIGSLIVGQLRGGVDIRTWAAATQAAPMRCARRDPAFAFWVMVIDIGKGWLAAALLPR